MFDMQSYQRDYRIKFANRKKFYKQRETVRRRESKNWCVCCAAPMIDQDFVCRFCIHEAESAILSSKDANITRR